MRNYETMVVLQPQLSEEDVAAIIARITDIIEAGGNLVEVQEWGIKTLAYEIDKQFKEGYYLLFVFDTNDSTVLNNLEHYYKITDSVIRSIVVRLDRK